MLVVPTNKESLANKSSFQCDSSELENTLSFAVGSEGNQTVGSQSLESIKSEPIRMQFSILAP
jgi:hypothetical protein